MTGDNSTAAITQDAVQLLCIAVAARLFQFTRSRLHCMPKLVLRTVTSSQGSTLHAILGILEHLLQIQVSDILWRCKQRFRISFLDHYSESRFDSREGATILYRGQYLIVRLIGYRYRTKYSLPKSKHIYHIQFNSQYNHKACTARQSRSL